MLRDRDVPRSDGGIKMTRAIAHHGWRPVKNQVHQIGMWVAIDTTERGSLRLLRA